jgi:signal transduction histidine kinase
MRQRPKSLKSKAKLPVAAKSPKDEDAKVRDLEKRLAEARERERATGEILRVISNSPTALQPVFDAIVQSAQRLLRAHTSSVFRRLGDEIHLAAYTRIGEAADAAFASLFPMSFDDYRKRFPSAEPDWVDGTVIQVPDFDRDTRSPANSHLARARGFRSLLQVPMRHAGHVIGLLRVTRVEAGAFADDEITLLQTFAEQAVIAIENVRLFNETKEALEQQTATSEILKVISSSPTDVQPVFDAIIQNAVRLCRAFNGTVFRFDRSLIHVAAHHNLAPEAADVVHRVFPIPADRGSVTGRAILTRSVIHLPDLVSDAEHTRSELLEAGFRAILAVPMLRDGAPIGAITVTRRQPEPFSEGEISLLQTFADQAVIAIENVRLFKELEASNREIVEKSRQIEVASQHKSEFLANMSHELRTPLNAIIGFSEVLSDRMFGELNEKQEEYLKDIYASGTHLLSLINDILDLSKIEAGRMELELTDFHLPTALDNALTLVRERAGRRSITLQTSIDEQLGEIRADERKIRQVVLNLLSNAIKFTPEGGRIEVLAAPTDGSVEVSVSDTGVGSRSGGSGQGL